VKKFIGIDLHSNNSVIVVTDEEDRILFQGRVPNRLEEIIAVLAPYRRVHLAHPTAMKKYEGLKYSGDFADAAYLTHLLRLGLLPEGYIYPREQRAARDLARKRMQLVRCHTAQILAIESILARETGARMKSGAIKRLTAEQVPEFGFSADVCLALESNRAVSEVLQRQIEALEKRLQERVKLRAEYRLEDGARNRRSLGDHDYAITRAISSRMTCLGRRFLGVSDTDRSLLAFPAVDGAHCAPRQRHPLPHANLEGRLVAPDVLWPARCRGERFRAVREQIAFRGKSMKHLMPAQASAQFLSLIVLAAIARWHVIPWLKRNARADALIALLWVHVFRYVALQVFSAQRDDFPISEGGALEIVVGDVAGAIVAFITIALLRHRGRLVIPLAWLLAAATLYDTVANIRGGVHEHLMGAVSGVTGLVLSFFVPVMVMSGVLLVWQVYSRRGERLRGNAPLTRALQNV
jgi:hypothetical protein